MRTGTARTLVSAISLAGLLVVGVGSGSHAGRRAPASAATLSAGPVPKPGPATSLGQSSAGTASDLSSQFIVRLKSEKALNSAVFDALIAGTPLSDVWTQAIDGFVATLSPSDVDRLNNNPDVVSVQPDKVIQTSVDQISPPWGLDRIDQHTLPLNGGYSYTSSGSAVTAYVVDTGINTTHTEFAGRIVRGAFVDFTPLNPTVPPETADFEDCNGHGTHVAGIIGGTTYGVAKDVSLVPVKVIHCDGSAAVSDVISGLDWIIADHLANPGPAVANLSFGGAISPALDTAVSNVIASGVTVVVAAGNDNADACNFSPSDVPAAITVAASDINDQAASFTNHGACDDIYAPGVSILSAWIGTPSAANVLSGTSMAAPHVAGVVARMLELTPTATPDAMWTALDTAATVGALTVPIGDPNKLLFRSPPINPSPPFLPTPPGAPRSFAVRPLAASATLTWLTPFSDGRSAITGYSASCTAPGQTTVTDNAAVSPWVMNGLINGVQYTCTVTAQNALGTGPTSSAKTVVPRTTPDTPDSPTATPAARKAVLSWTSPTSDGGAPIKGYVVSCSDGVTTKTKKASATASTVSISGLANGTQYACNVAAKNVAGIGIASGSASVTPRTFPGVPQTPAVAAGRASATITFVAPLVDGGSPISGYKATCASAVTGAVSPVSSTGAGSPMLVPGLTAGKRYVCSVAAVNAAGTGRGTTGKGVTPTL